MKAFTVILTLALTMIATTSNADVVNGVCNRPRAGAKNRFAPKLVKAASGGVDIIAESGDSIRTQREAGRKQ